MSTDTDTDADAEKTPETLPEGCITLRPEECERLIRTLRSYSREVEHRYGVPVIEADVMADRLESRGGEE